MGFITVTSTITLKFFGVFQKDFETILLIVPQDLPLLV